MTQPQTDSTTRTRAIRHLGKFSLFVAILSVFAVLLILFGARFGLWEPIKGFGLYRRYFSLIAYGAAGIALVAFLLSVFTKQRQSIVLSGVALLIGAGLMAPIVERMLDPPVRAAPIHDISTDTQNPPEFIVLDETRQGAQNSLQYGGAETAALQAQAYPDIAPILSDLSAPDAFARAVDIATEMGWTRVDQQDE
ncbi:MAG: hypothetical protein ACSHWY_04080, partial [Octadecabacter sp.]